MVRGVLTSSRARSSRWRAAVALLAATLGTVVSLGCGSPTAPEPNVTVPPDASMDELRQEPILAFESDSVVAEAPVELPADGQLVYTNAVSRRYVAPDDAALATAGAEAYEMAMAEGWEGPPPSDPGSGGVHGTTLTKGELTLDLTYQTSASFDPLESDEDILALDIVVSTRSSELEG